MVRLIMGANGAGKTKQLIELIHASVDSESGSVVCIEPSRDMTYDVSYNVRLVNASDYNVDSFDCLRGFLCGMYAGNFDIPMCSWTTCARSPAAAIGRPWRSSFTGWTASARRTR